MRPYSFLCQSGETGQQAPSYAAKSMKSWRKNLTIVDEIWQLKYWLRHHCTCPMEVLKTQANCSTSVCVRENARQAITATLSTVFPPHVSCAGQPGLPPSLPAAGLPQLSFLTLCNSSLSTDWAGSEPLSMGCNSSVNPGLPSYKWDLRDDQMAQALQPGGPVDSGLVVTIDSGWMNDRGGWMTSRDRQREVGMQGAINLLSGFPTQFSMPGCISLTVLGFLYLCP